MPPRKHVNNRKDFNNMKKRGVKTGRHRLQRLVRWEKCNKIIDKALNDFRKDFEQRLREISCKYPQANVRVSLAKCPKCFAIFSGNLKSFNNDC